MIRRIDFPTEQHAQIALKQCEFALGKSQRDDPRGIMFKYDGVAKWRNLTTREKEELHGVYERQYSDGPVQIKITNLCPNHAAEALAALGSEAALELSDLPHLSENMSLSDLDEAAHQFFKAIGQRQVCMMEYQAANARTMPENVQKWVHNYVLCYGEKEGDYV